MAPYGSIGRRGKPCHWGVQRAFLPIELPDLATSMARDKKQTATPDRCLYWWNRRQLATAIGGDVEMKLN